MNDVITNILERIIPEQNDENYIENAARAFI